MFLRDFLSVLLYQLPYRDYTIFRYLSFMRTPSIITAGILALQASNTSAFLPPSNTRNPVRSNVSLRGDLPSYNDIPSYGDYLSGNNHSRITQALKNILAGDIESLNKQLKTGLNPDSILPGGSPILHCLVEQANKNKKNSVAYRNAVALLSQGGGNINLKDSLGRTALEKCTNRAFSHDIKKAHFKTSREIPIPQTELNARLAVFSMQEQPTTKGRELIVRLLKQGADIESETDNGKSIMENIKENWSEELVKRFNMLVSVAELNNSANRKVKAINSASLKELWNQAARGFQELKGGPSEIDISRLGDVSPYGDFLGGNNHSRVVEAYNDIITGNIKGLNEKFHNGLNPNSIMPGGKPLLHCLVEQANKNPLMNDDDKMAYRGTLFLFRMLGGNFQLKDGSGKTAMENCNDPVLSKYLSGASTQPIQTPTSQHHLDYRLALFSMQEEPTPKGKELITQLVKQGADLNCEVLLNGKTIQENIEENWSPRLVEKFETLVLTARFNSSANKKEKNSESEIKNLANLWNLAEKDFRSLY